MMREMPIKPGHDISDRNHRIVIMENNVIVNMQIDRYDQFDFAQALLVYALVKCI